MLPVRTDHNTTTVAQAEALGNHPIGIAMTASYPPTGVSSEVIRTCIWPAGPAAGAGLPAVMVSTVWPDGWIPNRH